MKPASTIYTLGTSTRSMPELLQLLAAYEISIVVDVRRFPMSRFEHFQRQNLERALTQAGITYVYAGSELGGYRTGGYEDFTRTETFLNGIERVEALARQGRVAIMCAERFPWRCHRRFIGDALAERGWNVVHIIETGKHWTPHR